MAQETNCEQALQLAGQTALSGEMLAARWHVRSCPRCRQALNDLWIQVTVLDDQQALEQLLNIDLLNATCHIRDWVITWLEQGTNSVLASLIRLSTSTLPLVPGATVARLGGDDPSGRKVWSDILQQVESPIGEETIKWKMTFMVDSHAPGRCIVEVQVDIFDRWDMAGIDVFLTWEQERRHGRTDTQGLVQFSDVPIVAMNAINIILRPPQQPSTTNGPQ